MKNFDWDKTGLGVAAGIIVPALAMFLYYRISYSYMTVGGFINYLKRGETTTAVLSLCILCNLAVFYPFIWKEKWRGARGVLGATFFWAAVVLILKFTA